MKYRVKIRREKGDVKAEAEQTDGNIYNFNMGWFLEDHKLYPGEYTMIPWDDDYPKDAPHWVASGDLERVKI